MLKICVGYIHNKLCSSADELAGKAYGVERIIVSLIRSQAPQGQTSLTCHLWSLKKKQHQGKLGLPKIASSNARNRRMPKSSP